MHGKDGLEHRIDLGTGESLQGEVLGQVLPVKFGQGMPQLWRHFITPVGQHKQDGQVRTSSRQVQQEFEAGLVAPVEIFENEQQRLACGLLCKKLQQQGKQTALLLLWIKRGRE